MPEILVLFVLLPVAAASGWLLARRQHSSHQKRRASALSSNYFRGLNYLLNEQPDKAIEVFLKLAEINRETVETHLALGNLFRRRGEMDKAIRFHKHIISRPALTDEQRMQALLELGEDYMRAGLLDRAERLFSDLLDSDPESEPSARNLLNIYQQEKDWPKAIEQARRLKGICDEETGPLIAQFYCELAQSALGEGDQNSVRDFIREARWHDPKCTRACIIEGDLAWQDGQWDSAARHYRQACEFDANCLVQVLDRIIECHQRDQSMETARQWLEQIVSNSNMVTPLIALARLIARESPRQAVDLLLGRLECRPRARALNYLIELMNHQELSLDEVGPGLIQELMQRLLDGQPRYRCQHCGFGGSTYHWQCPSCRRWNTTRPIEGVLGE